MVKYKLPKKFSYRLSSSKYQVPTFLSGAFSLVDITGISLPQVPYYSTPEEENLAARKADAAALARDWQIVGDDLRCAMNLFAQENDLPHPQKLALSDSSTISGKEQSRRPPKSVNQESHSLEKAVGEQFSTPESPAMESTTEEQGIFAYREEVFVGPIPPPRVLKEYEETLSGAADRIFQMTESQFNHRQEQEAQMLTAATQRSKYGMFLGWFLALAFLGVAGWLISIGHALPGTLIGTLDLVTLVGLFVLGRRSANVARNPRSSSKENTVPAD